MKIFYKLLDFLKNPEKAPAYQPMKFSEFFGLLILAIIVVVPYAYILEFMGMDQFENGLGDLLKENKWIIAIFGIVLAPLIEEPIFRLHLDLKITSIWYSLGLSLLFAMAIWFPIIFIGYMIFLLIRVSSDNPPPLKFVVYFSAAFFGLVHITNFKDFDYGQYFYYIPFLVAIQFWIGLVLSYIRLNHGMKWAILFHGVYNTIFILPAIYFYEP
ncbi:CPBP family glutamic-type intramembrane protease [Algoriphagus pacificus]|uniref:CPBP family intramembrane metalloprotease n=1 Tax=Algoriphagus pacificus TaxID=2811234 RepID=A0ABS3CDJ6_9BACT|nr:CPBP family glutamic-type intramembrane protease [Algoriphagus pacificus]MBN7815167.1 CPBP family intramembrane metalloprotease [Algoriphagus pacificus]